MASSERFRLTVVAIAAAVLLGCATTPPPPAPERVVLLPEPDAKPSAVVVRPQRSAEVVLAEPYATATVSADRVATSISRPEEIQARYKALFDALPARARSYLLYFETGSDRLAPESESRLESMLRDLKQLPAPELEVIGHTDTVGSSELNDEISLKRAEAIRKRLVEKGIGSGQVEAVGRGERQLLVPTADGVAEPKNRRVEIRMR